MRQCQECGSDVAEIDQFCPFCGLALQSIPVGEPDLIALEEKEVQTEVESPEHNQPEPEDVLIAATPSIEETGEEEETVNEEHLSNGVSDSDDATIYDSGEIASMVKELDSTLSIEEDRDPIDEIEKQDVEATGDALEEVPIVIADRTSPGDQGTTPIVDKTTDGKRTGLKPLTEGTLLNNRYDIVRKIGGGGMGAVYLANDRNLGGVQRAVKEMVQAHIEEAQQAKAIEDFRRESMILSSLDHPAIPTIYDYFFDSDEGRFYLVMKYISGGDLAAKLRATPEGRIDERTCAQWGIQVLDVLDYLHNLPDRIVYRDLKPSNIMIDGKTGRVMLVDFGIARSINQTQEKGVTAVGTMGYAPPELFSGSVEPRSDIYSLGSTMFHLMTGADPQNNPLLIFDFDKNPRPRQINPRLSDQIERILMRSVEYNAEARFTSAAEMRSALEAHLSSLDTDTVTFGVSAAPQAVSLSAQIVFCGFCGQRIIATDMFCAFCGSKQPLAQQGVHREIYSHSQQRSTARLIVVGTDDLEAPAYMLERLENLLGRRDPMSNIFPEVDLSKYDPQTKISRRHAKIWNDGSQFLVEDLGSSNGTLLLPSTNETTRLTPHQPHPLVHGDRIRIGDTLLHFVVN